MIETRGREDVLDELASKNIIGKYKHKKFIINMTPEQLSEINAARQEMHNFKYPKGSNISPSDINNLINNINRNIPKKMPRYDLETFDAIKLGTYHNQQK